MDRLARSTRPDEDDEADDRAWERLAEDRELEAVLEVTGWAVLARELLLGDIWPNQELCACGSDEL
jgi:hypothetical protein